jgi:hypothetical protein
MKIVFTKVNSGISLEIAGVGVAGAKKNALNKVINKWFDICNNHLKEFELREFADIPEITFGKGNESAHIALEPWGFAFKNKNGEIVMQDSGSTPTGPRAKRLWVYQLACEEMNGIS